MSLSAIPTSRNLISHSIRKEGAFPKTKFISVFVYPDCVREYDGMSWKVIPNPIPHNLFTNPIL